MITNKIRNFFNRNFKPSYKLDEALTDYLRNSIANSVYFNFRSMEFFKNGFSMVLDYKPNSEQLKVQSEIQTPSFTDYLSNIYGKSIEVYLNINNRIERMMNNLENRLSETFSSKNYLKGGLNLRWIM